ncbi:MAG TPA: M12 family metallopeptidase [Drouetiella sp.]
MLALKNKNRRSTLIVLQVALMALAGVLPASSYSTSDAKCELSSKRPSLTSTSTKRSAESPLSVSGWKKFEAQDLDGAWNDFSRAIAQNPDDVGARCGRAALSMLWGHYNDASIDANYAAYADPDNAEAHWYRGRLNFDINKFADARDDFKAILTANPNYGDAHLWLAQSYYCLGDRKNAYKEFNTAASLLGANDPNYKFCLYSAKRVNPNPVSGRDADLVAPFVVENLAQMYKTSRSDQGGRAIFAPSEKWPVGKTITVAFYGGDPALYQKIATTVPEWSKYGNIKFDFKDPATGQFRKWSPSDTKYSADIRIAFQKDGYWSVIGQESINAAGPGESSMNFDPTNWQQLGSFFTGTILHEFGHALGFLHEHQHPYAGSMTEIRWQDDPGYVPTKDNSGVYMADSAGRLPGLLSYFVTTQGWSPAQSYSQIATYEDSDGLALGPLDTTSIMQYAQESFLLRTGKASPAYANENDGLSPGDKVAIQKQYPGHAL